MGDSGAILGVVAVKYTILYGAIHAIHMQTATIKVGFVVKKSAVGNGNA